MNTLLTRLRARPIPSLIAVVALLLAVAIYVAYLAGVGSSLTVPFTGSAPTEVVNTEGGYRIEVPDGWSHTQDGRVTTVRSPDEKTVVTFGLGRTGPLPVAATLFFQQVGSKYKQVEVFAPEAKKIGGLPALAYGGIGTNAKDTRIRFLAISVQNNPTNYGITVFTEASSDPEVVLPDVNRMVESFRELPPR